MRIESVLATFLAIGSGISFGGPAANPEGEVLTASSYITASYDAVWERFTKPELYEEWYSAPCLEFGTRAGEPVSWGDEKNIRHDCTKAPQTCGIIGSVGWLKSLSRLKTLLETGQPMPWPEEPEARSETAHENTYAP